MSNLAHIHPICFHYQVFVVSQGRSFLQGSCIVRVTTIKQSGTLSTSLLALLPHNILLCPLDLVLYRLDLVQGIITVGKGVLHQLPCCIPLMINRVEAAILPFLAMQFHAPQFKVTRTTPSVVVPISSKISLFSHFMHRCNLFSHIFFSSRHYSSTVVWVVPMELI